MMLSRAGIFYGIMLGLLAANLYSFGQGENAVGAGLTADNAVQTQAVSGEPAEPPRETTTRDPFWPIDYVPVVEVHKTDLPAQEGEGDPRGHVDYSRLSPEEQAVIKSQMAVGGILQQGAICLAIINKQLVKQGETLTFSGTGKTYDFVVRDLTPDKIVLESMQ